MTAYDRLDVAGGDGAGPVLGGSDQRVVGDPVWIPRMKMSAITLGIVVDDQVHFLSK